MNQANQDDTDKDKMEAEYDFTGGVRGKYFARYHRAAQIVRVKESPFVAQPLTESSGQHAHESTVKIGGDPVYQSPRVEYSQPPAEVSLPAVP